jgi:GT2 family glycosyltransferase
MIGFATIEETRRLGAPVVRLFRLGLGRDPDPAELDRFADRLRQGAGLDALAALLLDTEEALVRHGPGTAADGAFCASLARQAPAAPLPGAPGEEPTRAGLLAALAASPAMWAHLPLMPGLAPGMPVGDQTAYLLWMAEYDTPPADGLATLPALDGPLISIVLVANDSQVDAVATTAASLKAQIYARWELVLVTRGRSPWPLDSLRRLVRSDARIGLIEVATGDPQLRGLQAMSGTWAGLLSAGDTLAPSCLYEMVAELAAFPQARLVFTDQDRLAAGVRCAPWFKPGYSALAMLSHDAIGQFALFERRLLEQEGSLRPETDREGAGHLARRAAAAAGAACIRHIPAVLFHGSGDSGGGGDHGSGCASGWPAARLLPAPGPGATPVTVIVATRDRASLLAACAEGVLERTGYAPLELLIVDNGSLEDETRDLLDRLRADPRVRVLARPGPFNFAALNNAAAEAARGSILALLNNDIEILEAGWLARMVDLAGQPDVGVVGAKLLYPDGTVQHAGILLGPDGAATHVGRGAPAEDPGYAGQLAYARDLSAVTGACLVVRSAVWRAVGGMDERLAVTWNDVDFCLRVGAAGLRVVWTPEAMLRHHESASRGREADDPLKLARFRAEQALVQRRWGTRMEVDPFLNANLMVTPAGHLVLTRPRRARPWEDRLAFPAT